MPSSSSTHLMHPKYRPDIDGLRAIAVLAVVSFHAFPDWISGGFIGVDIFFVISGFLISTIIFQSLDKGTFSFKEFYARRIKRIFPALGIVLLSTLAFGWFVLLSDELQQLGKHVAAGAGFVANLVLWNEAGYFDHSADTKPLLHLWSLGIEEQFYIVWPLLLWGVWRLRLSPRYIIILLMVLSFGLNVYSIEDNPTAVFYSPLTRFWELMVGGMLAYYFVHHGNSLNTAVSSSKREKSLAYFFTDKAKTVISLLGAVTLVLGFFLINKKVDFPGVWALLPVVGALLLISAGPQAWLNRVVLSNKIMVWFGLISFPLYLWHWPVLAFARIINYEAPKPTVRVLAVLVSILLAWLTVKFIEKPFRYQAKYGGMKVAVLCAFLSALGISGFVVSKTDFTKTHQFEKLLIKRKGEHLIGRSLDWYEGKEHWLFLGNAYSQTVSKLKLSSMPRAEEVSQFKEQMNNLAMVAKNYNTQVILFLGPNKSSIYPEYLPDTVKPSPKRYIDFFLAPLNGIPNLVVYDPTEELKRQKSQTHDVFYYRTDTHWNQKGAFIAYQGLANRLGLSIPDVTFTPGAPHRGDLTAISKQPLYPVSAGDNWIIEWAQAPSWTVEEHSSRYADTFGATAVVSNPHAPSNKYVWVVGDSVSNALRPYLNATFRKVYYVGHWTDKLETVSQQLQQAAEKPDMILLVRVERAF